MALFHDHRFGCSQVREAKARGRPYTIVFVGVNGVGKSTNLAKVAYWLLQNDVSVRATSAPHGLPGLCASLAGALALHLQS